MLQKNGKEIQHIVFDKLGNLLFKPNQSLSASNTKKLQEFVDFNNKAGKQLNDLSKESGNIKKSIKKAIDGAVTEFALSKIEESEIGKTCKKTIYPAIDTISNFAKDAKNQFYKSEYLMKATLPILEGALECKKLLDSFSPELSDQVSGAIALATINAISNIAPIAFGPVGLVVHAVATYGMSNFLSTENLEKTSKKVKDKLEEVKNVHNLEIPEPHGKHVRRHLNRKQSKNRRNNLSRHN